MRRALLCFVLLALVLGADLQTVSLSPKCGPMEGGTALAIEGFPYLKLAACEFWPPTCPFSSQCLPFGVSNGKAENSSVYCVSINCPSHVSNCSAGVNVEVKIRDLESNTLLDTKEYFMYYESPVLTGVTPPFGNPQDKIQLQGVALNCDNCPLSLNYSIAFGNETVDVQRDDQGNLWFFAPESSNSDFSWTGVPVKISLNGGSDWSNSVYFHYNSSNTLIIIVVVAAVLVMSTLVIGGYIRFVYQRKKTNKQLSALQEETYAGSINSEEYSIITEDTPFLSDPSGSFRKDRNGKEKKKVTFLLDQDAKLCQICFEKDVHLIYFGCCQKSMCTGCTQSLQNCPFCKAEIVRTTKPKSPPPPASPTPQE